MVKERNNATGPGSSFKVTDFVKDIQLWILLPNPPDNLVDELQKTVFEFVWNRKQDRISRKTAIKNITKGGLEIPKIRQYINALKLMWVR